MRTADEAPAPHKVTPKRGSRAIGGDGADKACLCQHSTAREFTGSSGSAAVLPRGMHGPYGPGATSVWCR